MGKPVTLQNPRQRSSGVAGRAARPDRSTPSGKTYKWPKSPISIISPTVGGWVRDRLLGREAGDVDLCTAALPEEVMALFPAAVPTGLAHGTVTVPTVSGNVEITNLYKWPKSPISIISPTTWGRGERRVFSTSARSRSRDTVIPTLALKPGDLMAMGLTGPEISAAQKRLALHVLEQPEDNRAEK